MIHLLNGQDTKILDVIPEGNYWGDNHHRSLKSNLEKCEFMTHANKRFSPYLTERNRIIISGEKPESYREFIIYEAFKTMDDEIEVHAQASYLDDIKKSKVIRPEKTTPKTNVEHVKNALDKSIWLPGNIVYKGIRTLTIENYTNPFSFLKQVASEFDLELHFRIELEDYEVVRYVDMVEPTGVWRGREVEFGKDLLNISRKENTANIVTALIGVGPEREDGTRLEVLVEDKDALKRWGRNGQHLIAYYEPQSTDQNMTKERLRTLTENELEKRVKAVVEYESEIADLGNVPGLRNKEFYFGDQIKIKDTTFNPPLYLEARIHTMDRPFKRKSARKKVTLGDYKELTEEEVHAIWKSLQDQIRRKISQADLLERTYDKETIDQKDMPGNQAKDKLDAEVGLGTIETTTGAEEKANQAESNAKKFAVPKEVYEQKVQELIGDINFKADKDITDAIQSDVNKMRSDVNKNITDIASKVDAAWVNGQLVSKADKEDTYTIADVDEKFDNTVSLTEYKTDKKGIITDLESHETRIRQTETDITAKVDNTQYQQDKDTLQTEINKNSVDIQINAEGIASKVDSTTYNTDKYGMITDINSNKSSIEQQADMIRSKVDATYVQGELGKIEVGGRNLASKSSLKGWSGGYTEENGVFTLEGDKGGIAIDDSVFEEGENYVLSFKIKKLSGSITYMGGHAESFKTKKIIVNGEEQGTYWNSASTPYPNDGGTYKFEVYLQHQKRESANHNLYIQPNRSHYGLPYVAEIWDLKVEKGNKATDWTPAPEDTDKKIESVEHYASEIEQTAKGIEQNVSAIKTDYETFKSTANSTFKQQADLIESKVSETVYNKDKNGMITDLEQHDSRITQNANQIEFKASKNELNQATQRISTAESQINVMAGKLEFKAESSEVNALGERVDSAEIVIDGLKSEIEFKADRIELEGFVTANDLKVRGDLEFGGKLMGATGTFSGEVEAAQLFIRNPEIEKEGGVGLQLQTAMWQSSTSRPFRKTGYIDFNTLNNALEVRRYNEQGTEYALDGFSMHAKVSAFYGDVRVGSGDEGGVPRLEFDIPERINRSSIRWNANVSADYGLIVQVDGNNVASFVSKGNLKVNRIEPYDTLGLYIMSHPKGSIRCTDYHGWNNGNPRYVDVLAGDFVRQSTERSKDNIEKYEENALDMLDQSVIYQYTKNDKKEIGFILERETPDIIKREEGISGYSLDGLLVKSVQELSTIKEQHDDRINFLEMQVDTLRQELNNLKGVS